MPKIYSDSLHRIAYSTDASTYREVPQGVAYPETVDDIKSLIKEAKLPLLAAVMAGFGGVISEVGASIMVGGNIKGYTRVLTTATVMETSKGNFDIAIALSIILLVMAFLVNLILTFVQQRKRPS